MVELSPDASTNENTPSKTVTSNEVDAALDIVQASNTEEQLAAQGNNTNAKVSVAK